MGLIERLREHWIGGVVALCVASVGLTWAVITEVSVKPRDFVIEQQKGTIAELNDRLKHSADAVHTGIQSPADTPSNVVLNPTWVYDNQPVFAFDNQLIIRFVVGDGFLKVASLKMDIPDEQPVSFDSVNPGSRRTFEYKGNTYFFDVSDVSNTGAKVSIAKKL